MRHSAAVCNKNKPMKTKTRLTNLISNKFKVLKKREIKNIIQSKKRQPTAQLTENLIECAV